MSNSVHPKRAKRPHDVTSILRKLRKHGRVLVRIVLFVEWLIRHLFSGN